MNLYAAQAVSAEMNLAIPHLIELSHTEVLTGVLLMVLRVKRFMQLMLARFQR
jgi:hypothetical protein